MLKRILAATTSLLMLAVGAVAFVLLRPPSVVLGPDPLEQANLSFLVLGDQGTGNGRQWAVATGLETVASRSRNVSFVVLLGDNFYGDGFTSTVDLQWRYKFENVYTGKHLRGIPFYAVLGNHDTGGDTNAQVRYTQEKSGSNRWRMPARHYVRDFGVTQDCADCPLLRIVFLDTTRHQSTLVEEARFLQQSTELAGKPRWRFVAAHHPVRSLGRHGEDQNLIKALLPSLKQAGIHLYLSGHEHNQQIIQISGEPTYLVSGAGGKSGYPVKDAPHLVFGSEERGFTLLEVEQDTITLKPFNAAAEQLGELLIKHTKATL